MRRERKSGGVDAGRYRRSTWLTEEKKQIKRDLAELKAQLSSRPTESDPASLREFAAPLGAQLYAVTKRVFQQYWRTPSYLYSKSALCLGTVGDFLG